MNECEIFVAALEKESSRERQIFLDEACASNADLRQRIDALLQSHDQAGSLLEHPAAGEAATMLLDQRDVSTDAAAQARGGRPAPPEDVSLDFLAPADGPEALGCLGPYAVTGVVGRGGMGIVLKAHDAKLHRVVAIKVLAPELACNPTARKRFLREARAAASVVHQHVVTIHAVDENRLPYLVMEYIDGQSLQEKIQRDGHLALTEILRIGQQIASGLAAAHAHGLMHRDVKPANILLENGVERVRITDFGLARAVDDVSMTRAGEVAGTPSYMSPEQAQGQPMDARSDLFSFGSVLYAMCTGRSPFRAQTSIEALRRVCDDTPRPIREVNPEIPPRLVAIVERLLAKQPADRFQSAAEVAAALGQYLAEVQHPSFVGQASRLPATPVDLAVPQARWKPALRRRWLVAATVLICLIAGLGLAEATGVTHLAGTIIRIATGEGTLIVEVKDPGVKVTVEGDGGLVITGAGLEKIHLRPGSYRVHADKDGKRVPLERELVSIAKGGLEVVKVKLVAADTEPTLTAAGFTPLLDGNHLTGWAVAEGGTGRWKIEDGALTCTGPRDHLLTTRNDFGDFHLRAEVKINAHGNSGIYFRTGKPLVLVGDYEAQITDNPGQHYKTGSLFGVVRVSESPIPPDTWFTLEVIAVGRRIRVLVNGQETADYTENRAGRNTKGHIALQHHDPETSVFFRKIEVKELQRGTSAAAGAFVVVGGKSIAERKYDNLAEAVQAASGGDTIEVRGNGPFVCGSINISQALTIRAGDGFRPVINLTVAPEPLHQTGLYAVAPLVLEGLEFRVLDPDEMYGKVTHTVIVPAKALRVANCRFSTGFTCLADFSTSPLSVWEVRNCEFLGSNHDSRAVHRSFASGQQVILENCVSTLHCSVGGGALEPKEPSLQLTRNTFRVPGFLEFSDATDKARDLDDVNQGGHVLLVKASDNVLDSNYTLVFSQHPPGRILLPGDAERYLAQVVSWEGQRNLYALDGQFVSLYTAEKSVHEPAKPVKSLADWRRFWGTDEVDSVEGRVRYQGGDLLAKVKLSPEKVTPEDFRLRADSAGYRAGKDGKDLGADIDLVGPGPAYERWKKTPEYQKWLKDTAHVKKPGAPKAEPNAFVLLGDKGVEVRKLDTLAEAVQAASGGDTIEVRGNGPFGTPPIKINCVLTIRAGNGFRPVIDLTVVPLTQTEPQHQISLDTVHPLVLEGLEFRLSAPDGTKVYHYVVNTSTDLRVANCRFQSINALGLYFHYVPSSSVWEVRNCEFICAKQGGSPIWRTLGPGHKLIVENCVATRNFSIAGGALNPQEPCLELTRNTFRTINGCVEFVNAADKPRDSDNAQPRGDVLLVEASGNIVDSGRVVVFTQRPASGAVPPANDESNLAHGVHWKGTSNLYSVNGQFVSLFTDQKGLYEPAKPMKTLADWNQFWATAEANSIEGRVRYQGGDLLTKVETAPEQLTAEDFRLRADSPGYRAGPDGKDLGADIDLVGPGPAYERWKKTPAYQQWLKETGQLTKVERPQSEPNAFVLLGAKGAFERKFATLAEAVQGASDGDTIEVRGNGPFVSEPIDIRKDALTIRAAPGFRPILRLNPERETGPFFLQSSAPLVLEGLELQRETRDSHSPQGESWRAIIYSYAPLYATNCRFLRKGLHTCVLAHSQILELRNCEFLATDGSAFGGDCSAGQRWRIENCVQTGGGCSFGYVTNDVYNVSIRLIRNTMVSSGSFGPSLFRETSALFPGRPEPLVRIEAGGNVFDSRIYHLNLEQAQPNPMPAAEAEAALRRLLAWQGNGNLYALDQALLSLSVQWKALEPATTVKSLADWKRFWGGAEVDSLEGRVRYQGGDLLSKLRTSPEKLTPDDFRLRPDSAGYRAGPDGKDLGADIDLVGPGPAYERWKTTPEYQEWLKETGQLRAEVPKLKASAFVVLGGKGAEQRKFETLAEAVQGAYDGDTIEVRGNGPFITLPVNLGKKGLTIRAATGFRPVIKGNIDPTAERGSYLLSSQGPLVLEGLELHMTGPVHSTAVSSELRSLNLANCRFVLSGSQALSVAAPGCTVRNCEFVTVADGFLIYLQLTNHGKMRLENNLFSNPFGHVLGLAWGPPDLDDVAIHLKHNTVATRRIAIAHGLSIVPTSAELGAVPDRQPVQMEVSANLFDFSDPTYRIFSILPELYGKDAKPLSAKEMEGLLPRLMAWREERNLYCNGLSFQSIRRAKDDPSRPKLGFLDEPLPGCQTLADWERLWNTGDSGSLQGDIRYEGGDVLAKMQATPERITAADFRLRADSPGYRGGKDGKDLGADVDLVGPGPAYERWKKTPEYHEWLKDTKQVTKTESATPETEVAARELAKWQGE